MAAGATYEPIATQTLSSAAATVTFSSISQSYTDLILVATGNTSTGVGLYMRVGAANTIDTGSNYSVIRLYGYSGGADSDELNGLDFWYVSTGAFNDANTILNLQNYSNTTTYKTFISRQNSPTAWVNSSAGLWRSTSAINKIELYLPSGNISAGSTFTLYGIKAA